MNTRLPLLNSLWQQALRSFCSSDSSSSSKWVYAVFWRILPRNYPPPRWDDEQGDLDRSSGNKRNWMLVWEDGFCDFYECERAGGAACGHQRFGPKIFFKMSHEVYNFGEGLIGKVAGDNSHKWVHRESSLDADPNFFSSWNGYLDLYPKAWELQFNSGIQTIALVAVREGVIQLGSLDKVAEDLNVVVCIQRKFLSLQCIPGVFAMQRPYPAHSQHYTNALRHSLQSYDQSTDVKPRIFELAEDKPKLISPYSDHPCGNAQKVFDAMPIRNIGIKVWIYQEPGMTIPMLDVEEDDGGSKKKELVTRSQRQEAFAEAGTAPQVKRARNSRSPLKPKTQMVARLPSLREKKGTRW